MVEANEQRKNSYKVGYRRPPKETQFKPGQRANPFGRPSGSRNIKTMVEESLTKKIAVRQGDKIKKVPRFAAIADTFTLKTAQGDAKAAGIVINLAKNAGILSDRNDAAENDGKEQSAARGRPSGEFIERVDWRLLSAAEQIELAEIAAKIDAGGDITALGGDDFVRFKELLNCAHRAIATGHSD